MLEFEWDERKRFANLAKHKLDFFDAKPLFDGRNVLSSASERHNEKRFTTTGVVDGRFYIVVWTLRGEDDSAYLLPESAKCGRTGIS